MMPLDDDYLVDLEPPLREYGWATRAAFETEYTIAVKDTTKSVTQQIFPITGTVTIRSVRTGVERTYQTGDHSSWTVEFADDLAKGVYPHGA